MLADYQHCRTKCSKQKQNIIFFFSFFTLLKISIRQQRHCQRTHNDKTSNECAKAVNDKERLDSKTMIGCVNDQINKNTKQTDSCHTKNQFMIAPDRNGNHRN